MLKIKKLVFGVILSAIVTAGLLAVFTLFTVKTGALPGSISGTLSMAAGAAANLTAAILTARWAGERGLIHGTVLSVVYSTLYVLLSFAVCGMVSVPLLTVRVVIFLLCGALGGIIGVGHKSKIRF